jgi:plasmid stabilization system protein ParE
MAKVVLNRRAYVDLARLRQFLVEKSPVAADKAAEEIWRGLRQLSEFLQSAPQHAQTGLRELPIRFGHYGYVIRYGFDGEKVVVLRIFHALERR